MATPTVLRVKRRLEDNPQDALVLLCKRMKTDDDEISPSLFVFRGTVDNQETIKVKSVVPKLNVGLKSAANVNDIINKIRKEKKDTATENRYEIVNCSRGIKQDISTEDDDLYDLVDLQQANSESGDVNYTYDLYTAAKDDFDVSLLDRLVSIENYETNLIFSTYREDGEPGSDLELDYDDDSNDENNWRNEYPDTEPSSIDEEDMVKAMQNFDIGDDLSSDADEDKIYDEPPDLFNEDVKRYGLAYAKYKAKVQGEDPDVANSTNYVHCSKVKDLDEEAIDGYKDDSDDGFYYGQEEDSQQFQEQYKDSSSDEYSPD